MRFLSFLATFCVFGFAFSTLAQVSRGRIQDAAQTRVYFDNYTIHHVPTEDGIDDKVLELMGSDGKPMVGAPPVALVHGFTQNSNTWFAFGEELRRQGFRVFIPNWRGNGQGAMRSIGLDGARPDTDPRMVFDNLPAYDAPAIVDFVYKASGQMKILYIGHSMGAMMMHLALGGVSRDASGAMIISEQRKLHLESEIKAFVSVGSPLSFSSQRDLKGLFTETLLSLNGISLDKSSPSIFKLNPFMAMADQARLDYAYHVGQIVNPTEGILNLRNITRAEYGIEKEYLGSDVPRVFLKSIVGFGRHGYVSADGKLDYSKISMDDRTSRVPTLIVSADKDALAPMADQLTAAKNRGLPHIVYKDTGHIDLVIGRRVQNLIADSVRFSRFVSPDCRDLFTQP